MSSDSPDDGAGSRGTLPLGVGPFPSPAAPRDMPREARATEPMLPRHRAQGAEPQGGAQLPPDAAPAPRPPDLGAPLRLRGEWPAPSAARLALARASGPRGRAVGAALATVAIVALAVNLRARPAALPELPELPAARTLGPPTASAPSADSAPSTPEPPASAAPPASGASAPRPAARAPRAPRAAGQPSAAHAPVNSDVVDPWRH